MQALIDTIQTALADGATTEHKSAAAQACRTLLAAFESAPGQPLAPPTPSPAPPTSPFTLLGKLSPDQALDLLIAKLRAQVADGPRPREASGFQVQLVPVPPRK